MNYREIEKMILSNPYRSENPKKPLGKWRERWKGSAYYLIRENLKKQDMAGYQLGMDRIFGLWYGLVYMHF